MKAGMSEKALGALGVLTVAAVAVAFGYLFGVVTKEPAPGSGAVRVPPTSSFPQPTVPTYASDEWKTWQDGSYDKDGKTYRGYAVRYPRDFTVASGDQARGGLLGKPRVTIAFPDDAFRFPKTNFGEAFMTVSIADDPASVRDCGLNPMAGGKELLAVPTAVGGADFREGDVQETAAGNVYATKLYRGVKEGRCYEIALTVHTGNIANYEPGSVMAFDPTNAYAVLDKMLATFVFTDKDPNR